MTELLDGRTRRETAPAELAVVFELARDTRRASVEALSQVELAHRRIWQRDALLLEARADLERVAGANRIGRYSGLEVGEFRVAEVIGRGGGGDVYRAIRRNGDEGVALKVLPVELVHDEDAMRRFFREIDVCQRLVSPNIVRILGSGHAPDGAPYFAMELLVGMDLSALLRESQTWQDRGEDHAQRPDQAARTPERARGAPLGRRPGSCALPRKSAR